MKVVNKKTCIIILVLVIIESCTLFLMYKSYLSKETKLDEVSLNKEEITGMFAIMTEQKDGTYTESSDTKWPTDGYKYNEKMSGCIDLNGKKLDGVLVYDPINKIATVDTVNTSFCYLYFDLDKTVYAKVINDYKTGNKVSKLSSTSAETGENYDAYYYSGTSTTIVKNNVLYAGFCWKMVITTETKGVKLVYNGIPTTQSDGSKSCDISSDSNNVAVFTAFNEAATTTNQNTPAHAGYMYNKSYPFVKATLYTDIEILKNQYGSNYYYSTSFTYSNGKYTLTNPTQYSWSSSLVGYYTCGSVVIGSTSYNTITTCDKLLYVAGASGSYMYYFIVNDGKAASDYNLKLATGITNNEDGTYTLNDPIEITRSEYFSKYSSYRNYYFCSDLTSITCKDMIGATSSTQVKLTGKNRGNNYKYGNSFIYENGQYTLIDTDVSSIKQFWDWPSNYTTLNNNHYTCLNTSGTCSSLYYIFYTYNYGPAYITLTDGRSINDALTEMLSADDVNKTDSAAKQKVDSWYKSNILNKKDSNEILYSKYLENAIFCGNRSITSLGGWNPNGGSTTAGLYFNYSSFECANKSDRYTLKESSGGTEGYGNNALTYPIALLSYKELSLGGYATRSSVYNWLLTPSNYGAYNNALYHVSYIYHDTNGTTPSNNYLSNGIRPVVSLNINVEITNGDGTVSDPYQIAYVEE